MCLRVYSDLARINSRILGFIPGHIGPRKNRQIFVVNGDRGAEVIKNRRQPDATSIAVARATR